jgi:hypothetical protein
MSLNIVRSVSRSLAVASAALVIHVGVAVAAPPGDLQSQTKVSIAEGFKATYVQQTGPRERKVVDPAFDAQERARQLLLGSNYFSTVRAETIKPEAVDAAGEHEHQPRPTNYGDPQAAAQHLLLGQHQASHASATSDTESAKRPVVYGDAQLAAQAMLLGEHRVSEASTHSALATR